MKTSFVTVLCAALLLALAACSSMAKKSQNLRLGMTQQEVVQVLGSDYSTVAARTEPDGTPVAVLKFTEKKAAPLYLFLRKDKLVQWGDTDVLRSMPP